MKRKLFLLSLVLMTVWITGVFIFHSSPVIHTFLVLSLIAYIKSLMTIEETGNAVSNKKW